MEWICGAKKRAGDAGRRGGANDAYLLRSHQPPAMPPTIDPVTAIVLGGLVAFAVLNRLRWREKLAWFDRVRLERGAGLDREHDDERDR